MKVAVTGNVGSGKSAICAMLAGLLGARVVDSDAICRTLLLPEQAAWKSVKKIWPAELFNVDGSIDRVGLRERIFSSDALRDELEGILHPLVQDEIIREMGLADSLGQHLLVEVPLLYEVGWQTRFDAVVVVYAPACTSVKRVTSRDGVSRDQVEAILRLQLPPETKADRADYVIDNSGLWSASFTQGQKVVRKLLRGWGSGEKRVRIST